MTNLVSKVFVVDDDPVLLLTLQAVLRAAGYTVEVFDCAAALLARVSARDQGCVVLDLKMPNIDGLELQRALGAAGIAMPLIFVSGRAAVPEAVTAMKRGAVDFLAKPVEPDELLAVVARAANR